VSGTVKVAAENDPVALVIVVPLIVIGDPAYVAVRSNLVQTLNLRQLQLSQRYQMLGLEKWTVLRRMLW